MPIVLEGLRKRFGPQLVLDSVSLEVRDGELFVLLGASGSGKSTILRLIAGLIPVDEGRIVLHEHDVTALPPQQRGTGFVFQNYSVFRHMSVAQNVEFGLKIRGVPATDRASKRDELLDMVGLSGLGSRYADQLSGGQLQRVALARALAYEPSVLLLDEPFGALDVRIRSQLRHSLKIIQRHLQVATILVTHDQEEAFELADRVGVLERGRLLEVGQPEALYARPRSLAVATFLGSGMVLAGRAQDGRLQVGGLALPIDGQVSPLDSDWVAMLVRPEYVHLSTEEPAAGPDGPLGTLGVRDDAGSAHGAVLGKGRIVEQSFAGAHRRVRLRLPRPPATRQLAPPLPSGEDGLLVDALVPAEAPLDGGELWVSLRSWHLLEGPPPRLLVYDTQEGEGGALDAARVLAEGIGASVTLLGVAEHLDTAEPYRAALERRREDRSLQRTEVKLRGGDPAGQIAAEQQETFYELLVLAAPESAGAPPDPPADPDGLIPRLLERPLTPLLVVRDVPETMRRLLICTEAGESGQSAVRVGAWLARRLKAAVTLVHVTRDATEPDRQAQSLLSETAARLRPVGVPVEARFRSAGSLAEGILEENHSGDYDLTIVETYGPLSPSDTARHDAVLQLIARAQRPMLVVPADVS